MQDEELLRYSRHILLPEIDVAGQQALLDAKVLIIGVGGLGSPVAMYLAAAGVGELVLVDDDCVELTNLQRQIAHTTDRLGQAKTASAATALNQLNPAVQVYTITQRLSDNAFAQTVAAADVVVDCSDNFTTRSAINRACVETRVPLVSGAAIRWEGQLAVFDFRQADTACYACLYGELSHQEETCSNSGVVAPLVGVIGSLQALETLKLLLPMFPSASAQQLQCYSALNGQWRQMTVHADPACPVCGISE